MVSKLEDLQARMASALEVSPDFRGILYGESGVGKTVLAMQLAQAITPEGMGIVFADARQGWAVMSNHPELKERAMPFHVESIDDLLTMARALYDGQDMWQYVGCVVIDESSVISSDNLSKIHRKRLGIGDDEIVPGVPEWPDYNANQNEMTRAIEALQSVTGVHVIQVSHVKYDKDDRGVERSGPDFPKGLSANLRRDVHLVAKISAKIDRQSDDANPSYEREVQVHPSARVVAKTRIGGLPVKTDPDTLITQTANWLFSDQMAQDLSAPEEQYLASDDAPTDGITAADLDDDAPAYVAQD